MADEVTNSRTYINCVIDRIEGETAVLSAENGGEIFVPKINLPNESKEGSALIIQISQVKDIESQREQTAKDILNELFGSN